jgi:aldehyde dehydrogenase (NAD+)
MEYWHEENMLIDGELVPAEGGRTYPTINPATEEVLGVAADASVADAERAIAAARRAFDETDWATNRDLRVRCMRQFTAAMRKEQDNLRAMTIAEVGAPYSLTTGPQVDMAIDMFDWYAELAATYDGSQDLGLREVRGTMNRRWIEREAFGVVSAISAYNYPTQLNLAKLGPALAAGCTVVLKGAPDTPWVTLALARLAAEHTDFPPGVLSILTSSQAEVGAVMTTDPAVDMITFTGSTDVGRRIQAASAPTVKKCFLELGGKSAYLVLDDESLVPGSMFCSYAVTSHSGQGCAITSRLVVPRARLDDAIDVVKQTFANLKVGDPTDPATNMGPLISARQRDKVQSYVDRAVADGATIAAGGKPPEHLDKGFFFSPTLVAGADEDSFIAQEEIFGPVMVILPHDGDDDAVRIANNSLFGLSGAVHSADTERALAVARRVRSGTISVNGGMFNAADAPFGGYKQSGYGRESGVAGLEEFLQIKVLGLPAASA